MLCICDMWLLVVTCYLFAMLSSGGSPVHIRDVWRVNQMAFFVIKSHYIVFLFLKKINKLRLDIWLYNSIRVILFYWQKCPLFLLLFTILPFDFAGTSRRLIGNFPSFCTRKGAELVKYDCCAICALQDGLTKTWSNNNWHSCMTSIQGDNNANHISVLPLLPR